MTGGKKSDCLFGIERSEVALLLVMIGISTYMIYGARSFNSLETSTFPLMFATITIILSTLLLFRQWIPGWMGLFLNEQDSGVSKSDQLLDDTGREEDGRSETDVEQHGNIMGDSGGYFIFVVTAFGLYLFAVYAIGFVIPSCAFAGILSIRNGDKWWVTLGLIAAAAVIVLGFDWIVPRSLLEGQILGS